ncbi:MAG TPA: cytochrome c oxidase subunit II [Streptosporangiaceae bacterium]|nr:cytochrome c oxidase subunit II [Streptosporangiaceae bacterium]
MSLIRREPRRPGPGSPVTERTELASARPAATTRSAGSRRRRRIVSAVGLVLLMLVLSGCSQSPWMRLGWPQPATQQGKVMLTLWQGSWIAAIAVGAVVWGLILWACIFHRKRSDDLPAQVRYNLPIEIVYTVIPFILVAVLFYFTARDENYVDTVAAHPQVVVNVTGFQWSWEFAYPQYKVPGSAAGDVVLTGQPYPGPLPTLVIPEDETVKFTLNSTDVVHSFWVPVFLFKRDVIPDHTNYFQVTATRTGTFIGRCTELCGIYHSLMLFHVKIVTPSQFQTYMAHEQAVQKAGGVQ